MHAMHALSQLSYSPYNIPRGKKIFPSLEFALSEHASGLAKLLST